MPLTKKVLSSLFFRSEMRSSRPCNAVEITSMIVKGLRRRGTPPPPTTLHQDFVSSKCGPITLKNTFKIIFNIATSTTNTRENDKKFVTE